MSIPHVPVKGVIRASHQNLLVDQVNQNTEDIAELQAVSSVAAFTHNQSAAAATWSGTHNLNRYPRAVVLDSDHNVLIADVTFPTLNTFVVTHGQPTAGSVHLL
jgi:hypothetical protein